jgi:hypothetical protein
LSNKLALSKSDYFVVQGIYSGWWLVGLLLPLAFLANLALAFISRQDTVGRMLALAAAGCILALLWQILAIDWRNWIPESDFQ